MRAQDLKALRDKAIVEKFHHYYDVKRERMDDVLAKLSTKYFFLDTKYIYKLIFYNKENNAYYDQLCNKQQQPSLFD